MRHLLSCIALVASILAAGESQPDPNGTHADLRAAMDKLSKTGPEHAALAKVEGTWDVQSSIWMAPNTAPMVSKGSAVFTVILGGKWIRQEFSGRHMDKPFNGVGLSGYDTVGKHYIATWCDSVSTVLTTMHGTSTDGGRTITYTSRTDFCPMTGGPATFRHVYALEAPDRLIYTAFTTPQGGTEQKSMELVYTRNPTVPISR